MRRRIIKCPRKQGILTRGQIKEAIMSVKNKYIKIGRIGKMEIRIHIDVDKVDNGFILWRDVQGVKLLAKSGDEGREVYVGFPKVRTRIIELLKQIANDLEEGIAEAIPREE